MKRKVIIRNGKKIFIADYSNKVNRRIRQAINKELRYVVRSEVESSDEYISRWQIEDLNIRGNEIMMRIEL